MANDLQALWQQDNRQKENQAMWMQLIQERRSGFQELVRAGNQVEYAVSLVLVPLLALLAWKAKFPLVHAGYGLLAAALAILAVATRATERQWPRQNDHSLREHLKALIDGYDRRLRFLRNGKIGVSLLLCGGVAAVLLGVPGYGSSGGAWFVTGLVLAGFLGGQAASYRRAKALILKKREEASGLLRELPREEGQA